jgi:beta-N-acetylhexosaminidase
LLPGVRFRPADFGPTYSKFSGEWCSGVQLHVTARDEFLPVETGLHVLATIRRMYPAQFAWLTTSWEGKPSHFDLLMGTDVVRRRIEAGDAVADITCEWENQSAAFAETSAAYRLY